MGRKLYKTDIERIMDMSLKNAGFLPDVDYVYNFPIRGGYILDFAFPKEKIDIECDGKKWHPEGNNHDRKRNHFLQNKGWTVLRFTDDQIKYDTESCLQKIKGVIYGKRKTNKS